MKRRSLWRRMLVQVCLCLSLVISALTGAFVAVELRPPSHTAAARQVQHPRALVSPTAVATATPVLKPVLTPAPPSRAMLAIGGGRATPYGAWIDARTVTLRITLTPLAQATGLQAEAEVQPADMPFTGVPNAESPLVQTQAGTPIQTTIAVANLTDGERYHWRVRARAANGTVSPWSGDGLFGVSEAAPLSPQLAMTSVRLGAWNRMTTALFRWTDTGSGAPIDHFQYAVVAASPASRGVVWQRARGSVLALPHLSQGYWHVLVRAIDLAGNRSKAADWAFGLVGSAPPAPRIAATDPATGSLSSIATPSVRWSGVAGVAPLAGFEYRLSSGAPPLADAPWIPAAGAQLALARLADGAWYFQVRSVDIVGNYSPAATWWFRLDRTAPALTAVALFTTRFTPPIERLHVSFKLNKAAAIVYQVVAAGSDKPLLSHSLGLQQPGQLVITWNGYLSHHQLAPAGQYALVIHAVDQAGNQRAITTSPVNVLDKWILISISKDQLWAYQGNSLFLHALVTNGGPDTPTLPGIFHVLGKYPNFVFHSPWPKSSPLWYPDSPTNYALLYQAQGGYFIHDAPWRSNYGPGSNSAAGTPGGNDTGSHGCTNVPLDQMKTLYDWADVGTLVQIVQ